MDPEWVGHMVPCPYNNCQHEFYLIPPNKMKGLLRCLTGAVGGLGMGVFTGAAAGTAIPILGNIGCGIAGGVVGFLGGIAGFCIEKD